MAQGNSDPRQRPSAGGAGGELLNWGNGFELTRWQAAMLVRILDHFREHINDNALLQELSLELRAMRDQADRPLGGIRVGEERMRGGDGAIVS
jgi:hypothetical protein